MRPLSGNTTARNTWATPAAAAATAVTLLVAAPWLNPFASGPSPSVMPWLVTVACAGLLLLLAPVVSAKAVARAWFGAAVLSAVFGLLQYTGAAQSFAPWINQTALGEAYGNLRQRNQFASLTNIGIAALIWGLGVEGVNKSRQSLALAAVALLAAANAASASRTGLLQLLLLAGLGVLWRTARNAEVRRLIITATLSYLAAAFVLPLLIGTAPTLHGVFARMADGSAPCASRITLWSNVLHLIAQKPWSGWGWGELDFAHFSTLYPGDRFCDILDNAHNLPLQLAVELGIPVAVLACGVIAWLVIRLRPWREAQPARQLAWAVLLTIGVHSLLEYPLWYGPFLTAAVLCAMMLRRHSPGHAAAGRRAGPLTALAAVAGMSLLCAVAYAAWDYQRVSQIYTAAEARKPAYRDNTLDKIRGSWLFADQVRFAELTMSTVQRSNAAAMLDLASASLHYSPEPAVVERLIESEVMLGMDDAAVLDLARYKAAFPKEHEAWALSNARGLAQKAP
ncbi:MAG: O-antigen ligase C-terminal domain-containing protein [Burkholderiaceae bacterium]|nr:O-antigen ligase C-terminal domain-containing protein [Burkholderiaceae bacterium]